MTFGHAALPSCGDSRIAGESEQSHGEPSGDLPSSQSTSSARKHVTDGSSGGSLQKSQSPDIGLFSSELVSRFLNMPSTLRLRHTGGRSSKRAPIGRFEGLRLSQLHVIILGYNANCAAILLG